MAKPKMQSRNWEQIRNQELQPGSRLRIEPGNPVRKPPRAQETQTGNLFQLFGAVQLPSSVGRTNFERESHTFVQIPGCSSGCSSQGTAAPKFWLGSSPNCAAHKTAKSTFGDHKPTHPNVPVSFTNSKGLTKFVSHSNDSSSYGTLKTPRHQVPEAFWWP